MTVRRWGADALGAAAVAIAIALYFGHAFPDYDALWNLLWGDDLAHGREPQLDLPFAPAAHPLYVLLGLIVAPLGDGAADGLRWIVLLSTGALVVAVFRLGQELFAWPVGLLAAAIVLTRVPTLYLGQAAFVDLPAVALVAWAAVLEARRPRRGAPVLVVLVLAGLLRPELWLVAGAYWLWLAAQKRGRTPFLRSAAYAALAAAGPLLWALFELIVTGDALRPLHEKNASLAEVGSTSGLGNAPGELASDLGGFLQAPALVLAAGGLVAGALWLPRRVALPVALGALNVVAFLVLAAADQPLEQRYLFLAAAIGALLAAVAALGWTALPPEHPVRARWRAAGTVALVALVAVSIPLDGNRAGDLRSDVRLGARLHDDLRDLVEPARAAGEPLLAQTARPVPFIAFWSDRRPNRVGSPAPATPGPGVLVVAITPQAGELLSKGIPDADGAPPPPPPPPPGWRPFARNGGWALYRAG